MFQKTIKQNGQSDYKEWEIYTTECLRKTKFVTNQSWMKLIKCVHYYRRLSKFLLRQNERNKRLRNKIITLKSLLRSLENKQNSMTNVLNVLKVSNCSVLKRNRRNKH